MIKNKFGLRGIFGFGISLTAIACIMACGTTETSQDKIEITTPGPIIIAIGDTSAFLTTSRTVTGATGRVNTTKSYTKFGLIVGDASICEIANIQQIVGKKAGITTVQAKDEDSNMKSEAVQVQVVEKK